MKKTLLIAASIALFMGPAFAQNSPQQNGMKARAEQQQQQQAPRLFEGPGIMAGNAVYDCTGKYLGSDPDPHVRLRMLKEGTDACNR